MLGFQYSFDWYGLTSDAVVLLFMCFLQVVYLLCKEMYEFKSIGNLSTLLRYNWQKQIKLHICTSCEELTHWKRLWCWEGLGAGGEGDNRGWDGWMASLTRRTWVWVNSGSWWWTGRPGVLQFMGSQRVRHDWVTELNWTEDVQCDDLIYVYCEAITSTKLINTPIMSDTIFVCERALMI